MKNYLIYEKTLFNLNEEDEFKRHYVAIPESHVKMGIFVVDGHPELAHDSVGSIEAKDPEQAVAQYEATLREGIY